MRWQMAGDEAGALTARCICGTITTSRGLLETSSGIEVPYLQAVYRDVSETTGNLHSENRGDFL